MAGVHVAPTFVEYARDAGREKPLGIHCAVGSAQDLPFAPEQFDFVTAFMSLMGMPGPETALGEAWRVLQPAGVLAVLHHASVLLPAAPAAGPD
jgi:ubiquinone/menaquinone biosynthesis C-methylase UbiE